MKTLLKILHFGIIGAGIGSFMTILSFASMGVKNASLKELITWAAASFLIGVITLIMYNDKIKLLVATAIHLALTFITVATSCIICGYGSSALDIIKNMLPSFIIIYIIVYLIVFFISKNNEKEINKALSDK